MADFRYEQFCPLARAAEVLGQRWNLLVVRELLLGPQRFADLRRRLSGVSPSVLAERLAMLEASGVIERRELPPPAAREVYALTPHGEALRPILAALARWGLRWMTVPKRGDHVEPDWVRLAAEMFAARGPTPPRSFELHALAQGGAGEARVRVAGGPSGTRLAPPDAPVDASVAAPAALLLGLMSGAARASELARAGRITVAGDARALDDLPALFAMSVAPNHPSE
jgi:DNA-binding HxlR family transcriptional regulator